MKKYLLLVLMLLALRPAQAQKIPEKLVPAAVVATFKRVQPTARAVTWEKEAANYEAGFRQGSQELSVVLTPTGTLLETETALPITQLPTAVRTKLATNYQGCKVLEAAKIVTAATGAITYEAEVSQAGRKRDVLFRPDGTVVKR